MKPIGGDDSSAANRRSAAAIRLALFGVLTLASVYFGFIAPSVDQARDLVQRYGYYAILGVFGAALLVLFRLRGELLQRLARVTAREWLAVAGLGLPLAVVACLTVPYTYKVLYDEFVLQSTAFHMHQAREVGTSVRAFEIEGVFRSLATYLDKRPVFYPFLVSLLHDALGYREANAFALNTVLLPVLLLLVYSLGRLLAGHAAGLVALAGLAAFSLVAHNATGAGMEMLNLVMLLGVMLLATLYLERPDEVRLSALVLATVLLAQTRYESSLYVAPVAVLVLEGWRRAGRPLLPLAALLAPVLFIPYALHQTYLAGTPQLWELREGESTRFGLAYLAGNLAHARNFFFNLSGAMPNSWWLAYAGVPALAWAAWCGLRHWRQWREFRAASVVTTVFAFAVLANLSLLLCYYWGQLDDPIVSRLSLPACTVLALAIGWTAARVPPAWRSRAVAVAIAGALASYLISGLRANATHGDLNLLMREIAWEGDVISKLPQANRLIITNKTALYWIVRQMPAIPMERARWRAPAIQFHRDHHTFQEVLVTQVLVPAGDDGQFQIAARDRLPSNFVLEPIAERRFETRRARISRVKEIRLSPDTPGMQALAQP